MLQHWQNTTIELIEIGLPSSIRINTVCPANIFTIAKVFPIVWEEVWATFRVGNTAVLAEHQHSRHREARFTRGPVLAVCPNTFQKPLVVKFIPRVILMPVFIGLAIISQRRSIYVIKGVARKYARVCRMLHIVGIREHLPHLVIRTNIIPLMVTFIGMPERIER